MSSAGNARPVSLRVAAVFLGLACGWWLVGTALVIAASFALTSPLDATRWGLLLLASTHLLLAGLSVLAIRGLHQGSRAARWIGLVVFLVLALEGIAGLLTRSLAGIALVMIGVAGAGLLLAGTMRRQPTPAAVVDERTGRNRAGRRALVAVSAAGLLAWYAFAGFNLMVATGRYQVDDRPPCDASTRHTAQTATLTQWLMSEAPAQGLPIDSAEFSVCSRNFLPTVATGHISAGGVDAVRAGLEQRGCVWHDDFCTFTVKDVPAKARIHSGSKPTLELWPAT